MKWLTILIYTMVCCSTVCAERIYLSGRGPSDAVEWDFMISAGRKSGGWEKIPVPSNWEQEGFGDYDYGHVMPSNKHAETGTYRTTFFAPKEWENNRFVRLVFEGAMTETEVFLNGKSLGAPNMGGYLPFRFPLTDKDSPIAFGKENQLEVRVHKRPSNVSLDYAERKADYWVFGGIYRPVYLDVLPKEFINRLAIDARADGNLTVDVFPLMYGYSGKSNGKPDFIDGLRMQVETPDGRPVGTPVTRRVYGTDSRIRLQTHVNQPALWSPESPNLYQLRVSLLHGEEVHHEKVERFGFRTFEVRPEEGLYLNGKKIRIKGVNRNEFHPDTGRAIDPEETRADLRAIKAMNANAVRYHLPPSKAYMEACDALGLMVVCELSTWQKPFIDTPIVRHMVYELVTAYQNHPSVVFWANGNEGGYNLEVDELFDLLDIQQRETLHPWAVFGPIDTSHYPAYDHLVKRLESRRLLMPTEFLHGLYDGGHGAGLEDFWKAMTDAPNGVGGFLWCWADAAIRRTDQNGRLDTAGNYSADGIVGPYREKEASYYTIREIWSPIQIPLKELPAGFDGRLPVENHFAFARLNDCALEWKLIRYPTPTALKEKPVVITSGTVRMPPVEPGKSGTVHLPVSDWLEESDAVAVRAFDADRKEIAGWSWPIQSDRCGSVPEGNGTRIKALGSHSFEAGGVTWTFDAGSGQLSLCTFQGEDVGLKGGPALYAATQQGALSFNDSWKCRVSRQGDKVVISSENETTDASFTWTLYADGRLDLNYSFPQITKPLTYCAVGFDLADQAVTAKRWLGDGPYRIWSNRRKGPQYGLWQNAYNETIPGMTWDYPAFKGIFGNVDWMSFRLSSGGGLTVKPKGLADIGVMRPDNASGKGNNKGSKKATWDYPERGGLFLFHKVPAVGTKFKAAEDLGPQSRPEKIKGPIEGSLTFYITD